MSELQTQEPLPPLDQERILQIKTLVKSEGFSYDDLTTEDISPNGLYKIIYGYITKNYPNFPSKMSENNTPFKRFKLAMNNIQEMSSMVSDEMSEIVEGEERGSSKTETRSQETKEPIANHFLEEQGFGPVLNNILFTWKMNFGHISIWNVDIRTGGSPSLKKEPFGPQIDTLNYFFPELNILFMDNTLILLIPCHDKFMKQNNENFLSRPASSLEDFILSSHIGSPWGNNDEFPDTDSDDDDDGDGDGDENSEPTGVVTALAQLVAARDNNDRLIEEARDRITQLRSEITNIEGQPLPRGPVTETTDARARRIQQRITQITNTETYIRRLERLNQKLDQTMMPHNEAMFRRLQTEAEDARLVDEQKATEDSRLAGEARQAQAQAEAQAQAAAAGNSEEEDNNEAEATLVPLSEDDDDDY